MTAKMFECNQDLVKANCSLQDWQDYLLSFKSLDLPSTTKMVAPVQTTTGAHSGTNGQSDNYQAFNYGLSGSTKSLLAFENLATPGREAEQFSVVAGESSQPSELNFTFNLQEYDSIEKAPQHEGDFSPLCGTDSVFGINFDDLQQEDSNNEEEKVVEKEQISEQADSSESSKSKGKKQTRWRKQNDKVLFRELIIILRERNLTVSEFLDMHKTSLGLSISEILKEKVQWKGATNSLIERLYKLKKNERKLSYRDFKQLRKMYYQQLRNKSVDWDYLLFSFPGRTLDYIKEVCYSFPRRESILEKSSSHSN
jgi:hypothetical protein